MVSGLSTGLATDALQGAGAVSLLLGANALLVRRVLVARSLCAGQIAACGCAVMVQGAATGEQMLAAIAVVLMVGKAAALWLALARSKAEGPSPPAGAAAITIATALVLVTMFVARQVSSPSALPASNGVAMILALILIGPVIVAARPAVAWTLVGVLSIETGAALAAIAISPAAALVETILAVLGAASIGISLRFERNVPGGA